MGRFASFSLCHAAAIEGLQADVCGVLCDGHSVVPKAVVVRRALGEMHIRAARCARVCMDGASRCAACATHMTNWSTYNSKQLKQLDKPPDEVLPRPVNHRLWLVAPL